MAWGSPFFVIFWDNFLPLVDLHRLQGRLFVVGRNGLPRIERITRMTKSERQELRALAYLLHGIDGDTDHVVLAYVVARLLSLAE